MPIKWTPTNVQMLLWLAWGSGKYEAKDIIDAWPKIPGEEVPSKVAIQHKISDMKKGIRDHGVASYFGYASSMPNKRKKTTNGQSHQQTSSTNPTDIDSKSITATSDGPAHTAEHGGTAVKEENSNASNKSEYPDEAITIGTEATAVPNTGSGSQQYLATPPKTPGRGRAGAAAKLNTRKRRRSNVSETTSLTTEATLSEVSISAPDFGMKLAPEHPISNMYESEGDKFDAGSDGSDGAWVPAMEVGRDRKKRVRHR